MMKKKFVIGLLIATLGVGSVSLTSCKDTNEDIQKELQGENATLKKAIEDLKTQLGQCQTTCASNLATALLDYYKKNETYSQVQVDKLLEDYVTATKFEELLNKLNNEAGNGVLDLSREQVDNLEKLAAAVGGSKIDEVALEKLMKDATALGSLAAKANELLALLNNKPGTVDLTAINEAIWGVKGDASKPGLIQNLLTLQTQVNGISEYFKDAEGNVYTVEKFRSLLEAGQWVIDNKDAADTVLKNLKDETGKINEDALKSLMQWYGSFENLNTVYNSMFPEGLDPYLNGEQDWYTYSDLIQSTQTNYQLIQDCMDELAAIRKNLENMVTSLEIHTAWNPCFGGFNTPFGISSNVLMTFYGHADQDVDFPAMAVDDAGIKGNPFGQVIGNAKEEVGGWIHQANLGTLYFTVNPVAANVDLNGFKFETSRMDAAPVELAVKPSEKLLTMGFSRAYSGNGFYEVTATLPEDNLAAGQALQDIKVRVEDGMLQAAKDVWRNRTLGSVAGLAAKVYNQLKDVAPAYALRYDWKNKGNDIIPASENAVLSSYSVAVTAAKPLSFTTLRNSSFSSPFPTIKPIQIDSSLVDLNLKPFKVGKIEMNVQLTIADIKLDKVRETKVTVKVPKQYIIDAAAGTANLPAGWDQDPSMYDEITVDITEDLQAVVDNMQKSITEWIKGNPETGVIGLDQQVNDAIKKAVDEAFNGVGKPGDPDYKEGFATSIENQVNDMMGSIQDKLDNLLDEVNGDKYLGRLNKLIERYNNWNERLDHVLSQPNHYMQVAMFYNLPNGGAGMVSNAEGNYTPFKWNGGEGFNLWATTFNFETLAPTYKKFVAVTKIEKDGADITTPALLAKANSASTMATIIDGNQKAVTVTTKGVVETGHVYAYEITYRAIDFHGKTSTGRYYFTIDATK